MPPPHSISLTQWSLVAHLAAGIWYETVIIGAVSNNPSYVPSPLSSSSQAPPTLAPMALRLLLSLGLGLGARATKLFERNVNFTESTLQASLIPGQVPGLLKFNDVKKTQFGTILKTKTLCLPPTNFVSKLLQFGPN